MAMYKSPHATVGAVLYQNNNNKGLILLTKRNIDPFKGYWCFPGGHVDDNEKLEDAIIREVREETGLSFKPEFLNYCEEIFPEKNIHNVVLFYYGQANGTPCKDEHEVSDIKWFTIDKADKMTLAFEHNKILDFYKQHIIQNPSV